MSERNVPWRIAGDVAHLSCGPLVGELEFSNLEACFFPKSWAGREVTEMGVLANDGPDSAATRLQLSEAYIRGRDLVATYAPALPGNIAQQICWRAEHHQALGSVQLQMVLSMQTELLNSEPEAIIRSFAGGGRLFHAAGLSIEQFEEFDFTPEDVASRTLERRFDNRSSLEH